MTFLKKESYKSIWMHRTAMKWRQLRCWMNSGDGRSDVWCASGNNISLDVARGDGAVAYDRTRLAVARLYPPSGRECKMNGEKGRTHAVLATSTKVSMYRIFTLTAMRFFPEQEVAKEHSVCVCVCLCVKLPVVQNTALGKITPSHQSQHC